MNRRPFRAEPVIALTVLCATLSIGLRVGSTGPHSDWLPARPDQQEDNQPRSRHHIQQWSLAIPGPDQALVLQAETPQRPAQWPEFNSVSIVGMTHYPQYVFTPWLHYLGNSLFSLVAATTLAQAICAHYLADGFALPRVLAGADLHDRGRLVITVLER
ncbi:hypothetical protein [Silvimonas amylolytica]|uniref:Uncharacterized protein n=1 Tax=Silvimonas amylolytica TaxID=449663 RepID=A0ABQ2PI12_9NEIS|nr:hypothetical protein [Silvimonas amylolytica]GGP24870.1 hypothetical protein GCM10010971_06890 [Silvimonas amylolytica]